MSQIPLDALRSACLTPPVHPSAEWMRSAGTQVMDFMLADFTRLGADRIDQPGTRAEMERLLREPPPEAGMAFEPLLAEVRDKVIGHSFRPGHPRFLAFIPGPPTFASILGDCLASNANLFAGVWKEAAGAAQVEIIVLDWFKQFLGYPPEARGLLTSGGSEANLTALVAARETIPLDDRSRIILYASDQRHWSIDRAVKVIGLRPDQLHTIPSDAEYRLEWNALRAAVAADQRAGLRPWLMLATAGTTSTGSVDPLAPIADFCTEQGLWFHVDAAYGWPMSLTAEGKKQLAGIERADSITLDPHKWFAQPFEAGGLLVRRGELLAQTFSMRPEYMQDVVPADDEINFCDQGIALTRRFRALKIWFSIKLLGIGWYRRLIEHGCALAEYAQALLEQTGRFELTSRRKLGMVCFRYVPTPPISAERMDALQQAIADGLLQTGRAFLSTTRLHGRTTLRLCFVNWRTTAADVEEVVGLLGELGIQLERGR